MFINLLVAALSYILVIKIIIWGPYGLSPNYYDHLQRLVSIFVNLNGLIGLLASLVFVKTIHLLPISNPRVLVLLCIVSMALLDPCKFIRVVTKIPINPGLFDPLAKLHPLLLITSIILVFSILLLTVISNSWGNKSQQTRQPILYLVLTYASMVMCISVGLSMWWANQELFWGRFWNWDNIEVSSAIGICTIGICSHKLIKVGSKSSYVTVLCASLAMYPLLYFLNKSPIVHSVHSFSGSFLIRLGSLTTSCIIYTLVSLLCIVTLILILSNTKHTVPSTYYTQLPTLLVGILVILYLSSGLINYISSGGSPADMLFSKVLSKSFIATAAILISAHLYGKQLKAYSVTFKWPKYHTAILCGLVLLTFVWYDNSTAIYSIDAYYIKSTLPSITMSEHITCDGSGILLRNKYYASDGTVKNSILQHISARSLHSSTYQKRSNSCGFVSLEDSPLLW